MIEKIQFTNGLRILTEYMPAAYSATVMIWINAGLEYECPENNGISHFIEHLLFKGTLNRTAKDIVQQIESTGGNINAFTHKEGTCFYSQVPGEYASLAVETLLDMIFNPKLNINDIKVEKQIIIDEIKMYEDTPDELVYDLFLKAFCNNHPLGMPITGTIETISSINEQDIYDFMKKYYVPNNMVISIAGKFDKQKIIEQINSTVSDKKSFFSSIIQNECVMTPTITTFNKEIEQTHLCIGNKGLAILDEERYSLAIIDSCLGGGMSSRLFQKIREEKGLAYNIETFEESFKTFGIFGVYAAANPNNIEEVIDLIIAEYENIKTNGFSQAEIQQAKSQIKGCLLMGQDSPKKRASKNARSEIYFNRIIPIEEICKKIDNIETEALRELSNKIFDTQNLAITLVGTNADYFDKDKKDANKIKFITKATGF